MFHLEYALTFKLSAKMYDMRDVAYNTLVPPQLEYAVAVWDLHRKDKIQETIKFSNRQTCKVTCKFDPRASVSNMPETLGWRAQEQRRTCWCTLQHYFHSLWISGVHPPILLIEYCLYIICIFDVQRWESLLCLSLRMDPYRKVLSHSLLASSLCRPGLFITRTTYLLCASVIYLKTA